MQLALKVRCGVRVVVGEPLRPLLLVEVRRAAVLSVLARSEFSGKGQNLTMNAHWRVANELVAASTARRAVLDEAAPAAASAQPVLVTGETGAGRRSSPRGHVHDLAAVEYFKVVDVGRDGPVGSFGQ